MNAKKPIIFSDFDGTFSEHDIGHRLFTKFSGGLNRPLVERWKRMEISSRECISREAELIQNISTEEVYQFLDQFRLRKGAIEFSAELTRRKIPLNIVSDGSSLYVDYLLRKNGLQDLNRFCNTSRIENGNFVIEFPHDNYGCARCGCCKGARINDIVGKNRDDYYIVFIGDGLSDICAAPHADLIFARGDFLDFCRKEKFKAIEFNDFFDILNQLIATGIL